MKNSYTTRRIKQAQYRQHHQNRDEHLSVDHCTNQPDDMTLSLRIVEAVSEAGHNGLTPDEIAERLSVDHCEISERIADLLDDGRLVRMQFRRRNRLGEPEQVIVEICHEMFAEIFHGVEFDDA
jgi:predicted HTH transcriptional regulator